MQPADQLIFKTRFKLFNSPSEYTLTTYTSAASAFIFKPEQNRSAAAEVPAGFLNPESEHQKQEACMQSSHHLINLQHKLSFIQHLF